MARSGIAHHFAKMDDQKVDEARRRYATGSISQLDLALEYGISPGVMGSILRYETWKHVGRAPMARNITMASDSGFRAVMEYRFEDGTSEIYREGIYDKMGTVNQRISFWRNAGVRWFYDGPEWDKKNVRKGTLVDAWPEKATITWDRVTD